MTAAVGAQTIQELVAAGRLQQVVPSMEAARSLLSSARRHLGSARAQADSDPEGVHTLLYDAARKSLAAVLEAQGLQATSLHDMAAGLIDGLAAWAPT